MSMGTAPGLVALHNLTETNLHKVISLGALPHPSLAVLPSSLSFSNFGDISLLAPLSLVDSQTTDGVRLFSSDVYSPRVPEVHWKTDYKACRALLNRAYSHLRNTGSYLSDIENVAERGKEALKERLVREAGVMYLWLEEIGITLPEIPRRPTPLRDSTSSTEVLKGFFRQNPDSDLRSPEFTAALALALSELESQMKPDAFARLAKHYTDYIDESGLVKHLYVANFLRDRNAVLTGSTEIDKGLFDNRLRKFMEPRMGEFGRWVDDQCDHIFSSPHMTLGRRKVPYNLENVCAAMSKLKVRGSEKAMVFSLGQARSRASLEFNGIEEAIDHAHNVIDETAFHKIQDAANERFSQLVGAALPFYTYKGANDFASGMEAHDDLSRSLHEFYGQSQKSPVTSMQRSLARYGFKGCTEEVVHSLCAFAADLASSPTTYFEAKFSRPVYLDEFAAAAIPESASMEVEDLLRQSGIDNVVRYSLNERHSVVAELGAQLAHEQVMEQEGLLMQAERSM